MPLGAVSLGGGGHVFDSRAADSVQEAGEAAIRSVSVPRFSSSARDTRGSRDGRGDRAAPIGRRLGTLTIDQRPSLPTDHTGGSGDVRVRQRLPQLRSVGTIQFRALGRHFPSV